MAAEPQAMFKIQRTSDGLYSTGGYRPRFSKTGKMWKRRGDLTAHLSQLAAGKVYQGCVLVQFQAVIVQVSDTQTIDDYISSIRAKKDEQAQREQARRNAETERSEREFLHRLKQRYEPT